jgi:predicted MPP superfamily phosphohydrolase
MRSRIVIPFLLILVGLFSYLYFRVVAPLQTWPGLFWVFAGTLAIAAATILWLPLFFWSSEETETSRIEFIIEKTAHVAVGFLSVLLGITVLRDFVMLIAYPFGRASLLAGAGPSAILAGSAIFLALVGFFTARSGPVVRRIALTPGTGGEPLRIVQISDLHVGVWIGRRYVEKVAAQIRALGPIDFLILTGDIGDGDVREHAKNLAPIGEISARVGKFAVSGNHEGYWDEAAWNARMRELGFRMLENESVTLATPRGPVMIFGVPDAGADPKRTLASVNPGVFSIFLAHQPKHAEAAIAAGVNLQLSGHTHAGQFLPWSLFIGFAHRFAAGLYRVDKTAIYVNSGTGFWGPPFRLGTRSETTLIEFSPS